MTTTTINLFDQKCKQLLDKEALQTLAVQGQMDQNAFDWYLEIDGEWAEEVLAQGYDALRLQTELEAVESMNELIDLIDDMNLWL